VTAELAAAGRLDTSLGHLALQLARQIDAGRDGSHTALVALMRELRATLSGAQADARDADSQLEGLRRLRLARPDAGR